jgi:uncharacterized membrane-anchored protein YhcB (DUF1043 family)
MNFILWFLAGIVVGLIAGLLIGRKNPKVADIAQQAADKTAASVDKLKS